MRFLEVFYYLRRVLGRSDPDSNEKLTDWECDYMAATMKCPDCGRYVGPEEPPNPDYFQTVVCSRPSGGCGGRYYVQFHLPKGRSSLVPMSVPAKLERVRVYGQRIPRENKDEVLP